MSTPAARPGKKGLPTCWSREGEHGSGSSIVSASLGTSAQLSDCGFARRANLFLRTPAAVCGVCIQAQRHRGLARIWSRSFLPDWRYGKVPRDTTHFIGEMESVLRGCGHCAIYRCESSQSTDQFRG